MKAKDLAQILLQYPDLDVLVDGYEGGYEDLKGAAIAKVVKNYYTQEYYGPHELLKYAVKPEHENQTIEDVLLLQRTRIGPSPNWEKVLYSSTGDD